MTDYSTLARHPEYIAEDADMCVRSSDNILFMLHSENIRTHTTAFPIGATKPSLDPASFEEEADVLAILFKFIYPHPPLPLLSDLPFPMLKKVAYAAHKYQIAAAMTVADIQMVAAVDSGPVDVLAYVYLYLPTNDPRIDKVAMFTISASMDEVFRELPADGFIKWTRYRERVLISLWSSGYYKSFKDVFHQTQNGLIGPVVQGVHRVQIPAFTRKPPFVLIGT